jgi:hypothetical protein
LAANLTAGALFFAGLQTRFTPSIPLADTAAAYNGGTRMRTFGKGKNAKNLRRYQWPDVKPAAADYQATFDDRKQQFQRFDDCMKGKK